MSEELHVDPDLCEGHALCVDLAPGVFHLDDDEVARAPVHPSESQWDKVRAAVDACPRQAITISSPGTKGL
ncbi:ferredoxin [Mycolicibacterium goodii]|uniref:ferredoxin n=1 Tax=Mycolicibacterium goodii TaxID=134601 RepID=UPI00093EC6C6|nr:ferredoxin [Mycolicibacterium goodii]MBU8832807.1 ferredoxin [Mycolicibacterium goodii]OKH69322.1 hypothetical protein EB74_30330 [Mycobacterium sp. SWH-M5]PJK23488.1 ferredoxin [Mycolicibacterium goodii]ULN47093.1 ferredoxin [Mycolicibacterium goodii]